MRTGLTRKIHPLVGNPFFISFRECKSIVPVCKYSRLPSGRNNQSPKIPDYLNALKYPRKYRTMVRSRRSGNSFDLKPFVLCGLDCPSVRLSSNRQFELRLVSNEFAGSLRVPSKEWYAGVPQSLRNDISLRLLIRA